MLTPQQLRHHLIARAGLQLKQSTASLFHRPASTTSSASSPSATAPATKQKFRPRTLHFFLCLETCQNIIASGIHNVDIVSSTITYQRSRWHVKIYSFKGSKLEAGRCLRQAGHLRQQQQRQQQQEEPAQAEVKEAQEQHHLAKWKGSRSKSVGEAPPGCRSKRTKSSWLNCWAASCGRCNHGDIN